MNSTEQISSLEVRSLQTAQLLIPQIQENFWAQANALPQTSNDPISVAIRNGILADSMKDLGQQTGMKYGVETVGQDFSNALVAALNTLSQTLPEQLERQAVKSVAEGLRAEHLHQQLYL